MNDDQNNNPQNQTQNEQPPHQVNNDQSHYDTVAKKSFGTNSWPKIVGYWLGITVLAFIFFYYVYPLLHKLAPRGNITKFSLPVCLLFGVMFGLLILVLMVYMKLKNTD